MTDDLFLKRSADFSPCRTWRYTLIREWDSTLPRVMFLLLNPSTADENVDDPTNRRGLGYAMDWGYGACVFCNLFAFRTPYPKEMKAAPDPVGPENDAYLHREHEKADLTIAAWGIHGAHRGRDKTVALMFKDLQCMGVTKDGHPRHILYLLKATRPERWKHG